MSSKSKKSTLKSSFFLSGNTFWFVCSKIVGQIHMRTNDWQSNTLFGLHIYEKISYIVNIDIDSAWIRPAVKIKELVHKAELGTVLEEIWTDSWTLELLWSCWQVSELTASLAADVLTPPRTYWSIVCQPAHRPDVYLHYLALFPSTASPE